MDENLEYDGENAGVTPYTPMTDIIPFDQVDEALMIPERLVWDKKEGVFRGESIDATAQLSFKLIGAVKVYSHWTSQIGQPMCSNIGECCGQDEQGCSSGWRLAFEVMQLGYFYCDFYGLAADWAVGCIKRAARQNGHVKITGARALQTKFGKLYIPVMEKA